MAQPAIDWPGILIPFTATVCYGGLTVLVSAYGKRTRVSRALLFFLLANALWTIGSMTWHLTASVFWNQILCTGVAFTGAALVYFVSEFLDLQNRLPLYVVAGFTLLMLVLVWGGWVTLDSYMVNGIAQIRYGPAFPLTMIGMETIYVWSVVVLIRRYRATTNRTFRYRLQYLTVGLFLQGCGGWFNAIPAIGHLPIDLAFGVANACLIAYAVLRHRLVDLSIVLRRGLGHSLLTISIAVAYLLSVFVLHRVSEFLLDTETYVVAALISLIFATTYQLIQRRLQSWADPLFFWERFNNQRMTEEISRATASIMSLEELGNTVLDKITASMGVSKGALFIKDTESGNYEPLVVRGYPGDAVTSMVSDHSVVSWLSQDQHPLLRREEIANHIHFRGLWTRERHNLESLRLERFCAVKFKHELIGILALGPKPSDTPFWPEDEAALRTVANHIAVATENASLIASLRDNLKDLRQTQDQLLQAEKLSAVGQLIAGVAHELNNPLTTIKGYTQLLMLEASVDEDVRKDLERIEQAAERCRRIVGNLMTFARRQKSEKAMCNINEVLEDTIALQEYRLSVENITVVRDFDSELPMTFADRYQLQQVFLNIVGNAQYAMRDTQGGVLVVSSRQTGDNLRIEITDTGPGISPDVRSRLFEPFFTTKPPGEGTGLGLSICYGIVRAHDGTIRVRSEPGHGAAFIVDLPVVERRGEDATAEQPDGVQVCPEPSKASILVVDDEEDILRLVQSLLQSEGYIVDIAKTGMQALEFLNLCSEWHYRLILSDLKMPGLDGIRLYSHLRFNYPGLEKRIVFMTGDTSSSETQAFLESAGLDYMTKPFDLETLLKVVARNLSNG